MNLAEAEKLPETRSKMKNLPVTALNDIDILIYSNKHNV